MPAMLRNLAQRLGMMAHSFDGGIHPSDHKLGAGLHSEPCPLSPVHILPMKMHIGEACLPLVAVGDRVLRGQKIARSEGYVSVPVHASTSGRVVRIEEYAIPHPSGMGMPSIIIESDGDDASDDSLEPITDWRNTDPALLRERARMCGLAGLGGAVFPTFIKLVQDSRFPIETVVLNGIECEPWLTTDHRLMLEYADEILTGLAIIMHMVNTDSAIIAIEDNKSDAAEAIEQALALRDDLEGARVVLLPTRYPQGSEKQLIYSLTGREVPAGKLPMHIGMLCQNVATARALYRAVVRAEPLTERLVTVSGDAMPRPANLHVRIGTPMRYVFAQQGLTDFEDVRILHGGPMMGELLRHPDVPVVKSTNGMLAMLEASFMGGHTQEQACIRCGHCSEACPAGLVPNLLADQCRSDQFEKAESYDLFDCIECGACSYVCPSNIPLVHYFRYGKGQIAQQRREKSFAEASRLRSEAREMRIERENQARAARRSSVRKTHAPAAESTAKTDAAGDSAADKTDEGSKD
ncbi:electron transport complex subunit RsxC [Mariprofundus ferrooxydans]|uniref:Ion-translocating oxidoreductase complex subunit C n=1 Tax=Mariprofundus ferrooxydans PV-1 TaxID=314345 RepID=Q0F0I1_9PROT|nr:electron transport complex subunit RsxC [Mariprofundus ferrooxydans]EAU55047.1 electron transport complex protein RnfC [Mariprofundus ferrooxydans PV-1]KON46908.1 electron transporter RnfC [Mariprofundus ferrooxydans]